MAVPIESLGVCYFPVPKIANTSIKHLIFEIENGRPFFEDEQDSQNNKDKHRTIHRQYKTVIFDKEALTPVENMLRFAVVRDPVQRLVSCWRNRVVFHEELSPSKASVEKLEDAGLPPNPDLNTFALNVEKYRNFKNSINIHARPMIDFLGTDPSYFHMIFSIERMELLEKFLQSLTGSEAVLTQKQTGGPEANVDDLSDSAKRHLQKVYEEDYDVFGKYFSSNGSSITKRLLPQKKLLPPSPSKPEEHNLPKSAEYAVGSLNATKPTSTKCPACGARGVMSGAKYCSKLPEWGKLEVNICNSCGFGFVPKLHFDLDAYNKKESAFAPSVSGQDHVDPSGFFASMNTNRLRVINRARKQVDILQGLDLKVETALDFDAGVGALFHYLKPKTALAIESNAVYFPYLDHLNASRIDMDKAFEDARKPDLIVASHFLQKLTSDQLGTFLKSCCQTLNPNGNALFEVPEWGWVQHRVPPPRGGHEPHTIFFSIESFVQVLRDAGFKFRYLSSISFIYDLDSDGYPVLDKNRRVQMQGQSKKKGDGTHLLAVVTPAQ